MASSPSLSQSRKAVLACFDFDDGANGVRRGESSTDSCTECVVVETIFRVRAGVGDALRILDREEALGVKGLGR